MANVQCILEFFAVKFDGSDKFVQHKSVKEF